MSRDALVAMARRSLAHTQAGTLPAAHDMLRVPADHYTDPDRFQLEVERIFKRLPLALGTSAELREPGAFRTTEVAGIPVLLARGSDGEVRAFLNACTHRGAPVESRACGKTRRFTCPYHAWSYDTAGRLQGIFAPDHFGELDLESQGLVRLPTSERAGLVFVILDPASTLSFDRALVGFDAMLEHSRFADRVFFERVQLPGPNWKAAYDGYLDFYHLPVLHKQSFGTQFSHHAVYDAWGPHVRTTALDASFASLAELPEADWKTERLAGGVWNLFPGGALVNFPAGPGLEISQLNQVFPGAHPGESFTEITFLASVEPDAAQQQALRGMADLLAGVVRREDYPTVAGVQRGLESGLHPGVLFGRRKGRRSSIAGSIS